MRAKPVFAALLLTLLASLAACDESLIDTGAPLTSAQLRYRLDAHYKVFYCDPDYWPVARDDEQERALEQFPLIAADEELFSAILQHLNLLPDASYTDEQKLAIYRESKRLASIVLDPIADGYDFELRAQTASGYFYVTGEIRSSGRIASEHWQPGSNVCPICLSGEIRIATPRGEVAVRELRPGDVVYSLDARGKRVPVPVARTARAPLRGAVPLLHLWLDNGRDLLASGAHPTLGGGYLNDLAAGDSLGGQRVGEVRLRYLPLDATYDLLPASSTGAYWANGTLLASTLKPRATPPN